MNNDIENHALILSFNNELIITCNDLVSEFVASAKCVATISGYNRAASILRKISRASPR
jgi:hypothetical protein